MDNSQPNNSLKSSLMNLFGTTKPADAGTPGASSVVAAPAVVDPMDSVSSTMNIPAAPAPTPPSAPAPVMPDPVAASPAPSTPMPDLSAITPAPSAPLESTPVVPSVPDSTPTPTPAPVIEPTPVQEVPAPTPAAEMPASVASADELSDEDKESILDKTLRRVAEVMTEEDMREFERIDREDTSGNAGKYFLMTRVPHFEDILQEELAYAQRLHQQSQA